MYPVLLSIIVPVYNVEKYIRECVESLTADDAHLVEIILVNDGSEDSSGDICDELSLRYSNVRCVHKENAGVSSARNVGLSEAQGKYVAFVDADDRVTKCGISVVQKWAAQSNSDICFMQAVKFFPDGRQIDLGDRIESAGIRGKKKHEVFQYLASRPKYPGSACTKVFRREFLVSNELFFATHRTQGEDLAFVLECLLHAETYDSLDIPYYEYRMNREGSASSASAEKTCKQLSSFVEEYARRLTTNGEASDVVTSLAMSFVAYEYSIILWQLHRVNSDSKREVLAFAKRYSWVMNYATTLQTKVIGYLMKTFGVTITSACINVFMRVRKFEPNCFDKITR